MPNRRIRSALAAIVGISLLAIGGAPGRADPVSAPAGGQVLSVSTTRQLVAALRQARGGERIALAAGTYEPFSLRNIAPASTVVVTSQHPESPAILAGVNLRGGRNLTLRALTFRSAGTAVQEDFLFHGVRNLTLADLRVTGRPGPAGFRHDKLVQLRECIGATITGSDFTNAYIAVSLLDTDSVSVTFNHFHGLRMDAIRGGGNSNLLIGYNFFTDFSPEPADHPDAIQLWTSRQRAAAHDIAIVGNVVLRGAGRAMQGIFLRDEVGRLPYRNVRIADNVVVGGMFNGIAVLSASDTVEVRDNIVAAYPDQKSWIRVADQAVLTGNAAPIYLIGDRRDDFVRHNRVLLPRADRGAAALRGWARGRAFDRYSEGLRRHVAAL